ncbi:cytotoxin [Vibrio parahaemolyticus]|uniref:cytotoxic necrotizing factor Rho-activating domain-containing protein n=1 Tax=Vibrio parahaemolyticus TaxID=670 RepID=UPI001A34ECC1|nr:cytotoxic necrotizing factor Rho-activating domain-containing protein [Vibrio parahaemolyticus]EGQ7900808.1 cytotoxin [Vibrio parahaemolyticus]EGQ8960953.1 cytotoxin [Vibrio parahaemolyticus]EGQ9505993.1 cytotoxin [Vibrio parahaemolyticus]EGR1786433.1 cytotoxin [Vibrio parahaemolyticus]EGR2384320.1 cytotoxin [Vibrio parahaemolyticus]
MLELKQIFRKTCNPSFFESFNEQGLQLKSVRHLSTEERAKIKRVPFPKGGVTQAKNIQLETLVADSTVLNGSNQLAIKAFASDPKFNKNNTQKSGDTNTKLMKSLEKGDVSVLKGKGIIGGESTTTQLPFKCDIVKYDKNGFKSASGINQAQFGIQVITGKEITSAQLIPGTPLGQFYNTNSFSDQVSVVYIPNGERGLTALKVPLSDIEKNKNILVSSGALSGCTSVTAMDKNNLYVFHVGKSGNDTSTWKTNKDGAAMVKQCAEKMSGVSSQSSGVVSELQSLVNYCSKAFEQATIQFCGHGEKIKNPKNVNVFDYNKPQKNKPFRVGNHVTLISNSNGNLHISTLCDDMWIDNKRYNTQSIDNKVVKFV